MNVLVTAASKHGSTHEIGEAIATQLQAMGILAEYHDLKNPVAKIDAYDAVVLGSAIYMGNWLPEAREFAATHRARLEQIPVYFFSSGPLGDENPTPAEPPAPVEKLRDQVHAREHRVFAGRLDPADLGLGERVMVKVVKAPTGDFRAWSDIQEWAKHVGDEILSGSGAT
jgi:menaquinone-dependent protoporphyrinogen oxidase